MFGGERTHHHLWHRSLLSDHPDQIILKYSPRLTEYLHKFRPFHLDTSLPKSKSSEFDISSDQVSSSGSVSISVVQSEHKFKVPFPPQSGPKLNCRVKYQQFFADNNIADKFVISEERETECQPQEDNLHLQHADQSEVLQNLGKTFFIQACELNMIAFLFSLYFSEKSKNHICNHSENNTLRA